MVWMQKVLDFLVSVWIHIFLFSWESRFRCIGSVLGIPRRDDWYNKIWKKEKKFTTLAMYYTYSYYGQIMAPAL